MIKSKYVAVPNGVVFLSDPSGGKIPEPVRGAMFLSTSSCIGIGCKVDCEGHVEFVIGLDQEVNPGEQPAFAGTLATPNRAVVVSSVRGEAILAVDVPTVSTEVRIWVNDPSEPDRVVVGLG